MILDGIDTCNAILPWVANELFTTGLPFCLPSLYVFISFPFFFFFFLFPPPSLFILHIFPFPFPPLYPTRETSSSLSKNGTFGHCLLLVSEVLFSFSRARENLEIEFQSRFQLFSNSLASKNTSILLPGFFYVSFFFPCLFLSSSSSSSSVL